MKNDRYRVVTLATNTQSCIRHEFTGLNELMDEMASRGHTFKGVTPPTRVKPELRGQPMFKGVYGPRWDYDAVCYERRVSYG